MTMLSLLGSGALSYSSPYAIGLGALSYYLETPQQQGLRVRHTLYPSIYTTYRHGIPTRTRIFPYDLRKPFTNSIDEKSPSRTRTGLPTYRAGFDMFESYSESTKPVV
uniref:Uncharacterized protein n=1 Tax=Oryza sativa subsp. japonica TaxID=39947 RepID=Q6Z003_ORYSJ|nr:hypothetical protein [Oryza sativa Japonica Group]